MQKNIYLLLSLIIFSCGNQEYRDLNKNGKLDIYEDKNQSVENRVNDLISQMEFLLSKVCMLLSFQAILREFELKLRISK